VIAADSSRYLFELGTSQMGEDSGRFVVVVVVVESVVLHAAGGAAYHMLFEQVHRMTSSFAGQRSTSTSNHYIPD